MSENLYQPDEEEVEVPVEDETPEIESVDVPDDMDVDDDTADDHSADDEAAE